MRKHDKCARARRRHVASPLPAVDFVAVRARAAVHSAAAVAPTSAAPVLRLAAAAVLLTATYKGAAVSATALACSNGDPSPSPFVLPHLLQNQILTSPSPLPESGAIASFPSDEICGIVPRWFPNPFKKWTLTEISKIQPSQQHHCERRGVTLAQSAQRVARFRLKFASPLAASRRRSMTKRRYALDHYRLQHRGETWQ